MLSFKLKSEIRPVPLYLLLVSTLIFLFLLTTTSDSLRWLTSSHDKVAHFTAFTYESYLFIRLFRSKTFTYTPYSTEVNLDVSAQNNRMFKISKYVAVGLVCLFFAITSEFIQFYLSGGARKCDPYDMIANGCGMILGIGIAYIQERSDTDSLSI